MANGLVLNVVFTSSPCQPSNLCAWLPCGSRGTLLKRLGRSWTALLSRNMPIKRTKCVGIYVTYEYTMVTCDLSVG